MNLPLQVLADYLLKDRLGRLGPAIRRVLENRRLLNERRQIDRQVHRVQKQLANILEYAAESIIAVNENDQIVVFNKAAEKTFGRSAQEVLGQPLDLLIPDRLVRAHREHVRNFAASPDTSRPIEHRQGLVARRKDGSEFPVEIGLSKLETEDGIIFTATVVDITERKRVEQALQEKERLLSEAQRIGRMGSWSYDIAKDNLQFSDEMYRLLDILPEEFHNHIEELLGAVYSLDRSAVSAWVDEIKAGRQVRELEFRVFHRNGELRYIQCRGAVEFDAIIQPARFIGMAQDITERKLAEIQIDQQIQRLNALRKIDQAITSNFNLRFTLNRILLEVSAQLQVDAADILLLDPDEEILEYAAGKGFRTKAVEAARVRLGESYAGQAAKERRLIKIENLKYQPDHPFLTTLLDEEHFVCYYGVPLISKGKVRGVLEVFHRQPLQPYPGWLDFLATLAGQAAIAIDNATLFENLERSNRELSQAYDATIEGWSRALDLRDKETEGHTLRVTEMTIRLAREFGFTEKEIMHIRWGALLHDIGKMGVPDHILLKPKPLTEAEQIMMQKHPQYAYDLLEPIAFLESALDIPYCHHEKWDGTGYPRGLKGEEIPIAARLFAIADVWDALTSDRPYRAAMSEEQTLAYIREQAGKHFDPQVVDLFFKIVK